MKTEITIKDINYAEKRGYNQALKDFVEKCKEESKLDVLGSHTKDAFLFDCIPIKIIESIAKELEAKE